MKQRQSSKTEARFFVGAGSPCPRRPDLILEEGQGDPAPTLFQDSVKSSNKRSEETYFSFLGTSFCLCVFVLSVLLSACGDNTGQDVPKVGAVATDFQLKETDGTAVKLSEFKGKPVLLNFWATWCLPCRYEMPEIASAYKQYQKEGLVVLGINLQEDTATIKKYVKENGYSWPMLLDQDSNLKTKYNVIGSPTSIFIDRQGVIRSIYIGGMEKEALSQELAKIL